MKQATKCECGHMALVHLHKCQVKGCKCRGFVPETKLLAIPEKAK